MVFLLPWDFFALDITYLIDGDQVTSSALLSTRDYSAVYLLGFIRVIFFWITFSIVGSDQKRQETAKERSPS